MQKIVILGAGFAGMTAALELDQLAGEKKAEVVLVEQNSHFSMGFSMQWVLAGRRSPEEGKRDYLSLQAPHTTLICDEIISIDTHSPAVRTKSYHLPYDYLLVALGAELAPEVVPGLAEGGYNLCDFSSIRQLKDAVERIEEGTILIAVSAIPFKCPPAPYEYALLIDDILRQRGVRERVRIMVTTPEPQPLPVAGKAVGEAVKGMLAERGVEFYPEYKPKQVEIGRKVVRYENGSSLAFDILGAMPPHRAPRAVREAGLADASGFVPVDLWTMKTRVPGVFAAGDVASLTLPNGKPHPKAGIFAEAQARVAARQIKAEILGTEPAKYEGKGVCYVDTGKEQAAPAEADLLSPEGPRILLGSPSAEGLEGKRQFERERLLKWFGR